MQRYLCNNPAVLQRADPWIYRHTDGYYYFVASVPEYDRIELRRAPVLANLGGAEPVTVWRKRESGILSSHIWAPELHFVNSCWYIYFAATDRPTPLNGLFNHRMYVLENSHANPLEGEWIERGQIETRWDTFSLDATSFTHKGVQYLVWAQKDPSIPGNSNLYIAAMKNPWTIDKKQIMLSKPEMPWETVGFSVNEGPAVIIHGKKVFISYSCSVTDANYCMGLLTANTDDDLLNPENWIKSPKPVFKTSKESHQYGPGHNCFTETEDGRTTLLVYHARNYESIIGDPLYDLNRHTRIQPLDWTIAGYPVFGEPVKDGPVFLRLDREERV